jgi:hypothetical protein
MQWRCKYNRRSGVFPAFERTMIFHALDRSTTVIAVIYQEFLIFVQNCTENS